MVIENVFRPRYQPLAINIYKKTNKAKWEITIFAFRKILYFMNDYKIQYEPPVFEVFNLQAEGIVCSSGRYNGFGEEEVW